MSEFQILQAQIAEVPNLSELSRVCGISRDHLRRIRDGSVGNTTLTTIDRIRGGIQKLKAAPPRRIAAVRISEPKEAA